MGIDCAHRLSGMPALRVIGADADYQQRLLHVHPANLAVILPATKELQFGAPRGAVVEPVCGVIEEVGIGRPYAVSKSNFRADEGLWIVDECDALRECVTVGEDVCGE